MAFMPSLELPSSGTYLRLVCTELLVFKQLPTSRGTPVTNCLFVYSYVFFGEARLYNADRGILKPVGFPNRVSDTVQLVLVTHALYYYMVSNYDNPIILLYPNWSILSQVFATATSGIIVRGVFAWRVWLSELWSYVPKASSLLCPTVTRHNKILIIIIALATVSTFVCGVAFAASGFFIGTFVNLMHISHFLYTALASSVAADTLIAASLCVSLSKSRTGFKTTDSLVNVLMLYAINSGRY
ncbi:hypothetical protein AX17_005530 [Amanita inopinata Kibby_2008]|nr:hypothetical protein AX17_005530 [Amanita inopinata Kibby_2008]